MLDLGLCLNPLVGFKQRLYQCAAEKSNHSTVLTTDSWTFLPTIGRYWERFMLPFTLTRPRHVTDSSPNVPGDNEFFSWNSVWFVCLFYVSKYNVIFLRFYMISTTLQCDIFTKKMQNYHVVTWYAIVMVKFLPAINEGGKRSHFKVKIIRLHRVSPLFHPKRAAMCFHTYHILVWPINIFLTYIW